ncbi:unnamed protein product [Lepeophtheirus salmonis]|uniref:(salmon louse) hypothetical protein n=1 Tax=Lepeophtheirus salmonis TaxID=72036 RepID=A0A7R8HA85_LEPSM|nr:unnamed protein product [Lepeophtheirus salmonis]CAF2968424.1 unnamed protein product [Lepeophtheirus salmonis]
MSSRNSSIEELRDICGVPNEALRASLEIWADGVTVSAIGIFGLVGNILSILTISTMNRLKLFYKLILTLAVFDLMFITCGGLLMVQQAFQFQSDIYNALFPHIIYPGSGFSMTASLGLNASANEFCMRGDTALEDLNGVKKVVKDILIFASNPEEHINRVKLILVRCESVKSAGFIASSNPISLDPEKSRSRRSISFTEQFDWSQIIP